MLARCPRCDYSLEGLPHEHTCPECGLRYDANSRVWHYGMSRGALAYSGFAALYLLALVSKHGRRALLPQAWQWSLLWHVGLSLLCGLAMLGLIRGWVLNRRGLRVAVTSEGLFVHTLELRSTLISWPDIVMVRTDTKGWTHDPVAELTLKNGKACALRHVFKNQAEATEFATVVRARMAAARGDAAKAAPNVS